MARKKHKKSSGPLKCKRGCNISKALCPHIEALLPQPDDGRLAYDTKEQLHHEQYSGIKQDEFERRARALERQLSKIGLEEFRIRLLMDRFISRFSLQEISDKDGYTDKKAVFRLIKQTLERLKLFDRKFIEELVKYNSDSE